MVYTILHRHRFYDVESAVRAYNAYMPWPFLNIRAASHPKGILQGDGDKPGKSLTTYVVLSDNAVEVEAEGFEP